MYNTKINGNFSLLQLQTFQPLLRYNCSQHLRLFVCSVFIPFCSEHVPGAVPACRALCETVKDDCMPLLNNFSLPWPAELDCNRFPAPPALCMQVPSNEEVLHHPTTSNSTVLKLEINNFKSTYSNCPPRFQLVDDTCTPLCGEDAYYRTADKTYTKIWAVVWSAVCAILCAILVLTFCIDSTRFQYPERPLLFMGICALVYSILTLFITLLGPRNIICNNNDHLVTKPAENMLCISSAFVLHFLELVIRFWWTIFSLCWYLHAWCEWSNESLAGMSSLFHAVVYGFCGIPSLLAVATGHVASDELTGSCMVKEESSLWFIVVPHGIFVVIGCVFCIGTANALFKVRRSLLAAAKSVEKLQRLMYRLAIFTLLFFIPEVCYLICTTYESWHRPWWKSLALLSALDCKNCSQEPVYHSAKLQVVLVKIASNLLIILPCVMWVCSRKTCRTWKRVLNVPGRSMSKVPITKV